MNQSRLTRRPTAKQCPPPLHLLISGSLHQLRVIPAVLLQHLREVDGWLLQRAFWILDR